MTRFTKPAVTAAAAAGFIAIASAASAAPASPPSWSGNSVAGKAITKHERRDIIHYLEYQMGLTRPEFKVECHYVSYPPANTGQTGYYPSLKTTCRVRQLVTAP